MKTIKELDLEISELKKKIRILEDENTSLWFLLDELEKSNISNKAYKENFEKLFKNIRMTGLMVHSKVEKA